MSDQRTLDDQVVEPNYKQLYEDLQLELKRQIIFAHMNQEFARQQNAKNAFLFFKGWKEACVKLLTGEVRDHVKENLMHAEKNLDVKSALEKLNQSVAEGLSFLD